MTGFRQVYKCEVCGNIVEVFEKAGGTLVCCGKPMTLLEANTEDAALEKHVPVVKKEGSEVFVKIGEVQHPMTSEHYIKWIEVLTEDKSYVKFLNPNEKPEASFKVDGEIKEVREYCNIHGLWKK
ncbi:MAG: desulfoferrodoxin [Clostridium sp.]|nr:desulfoferrodoxin [Clostridium sp.]